MSKNIYVLVWQTESSDRGVDGYWNRELTEAEQHAYFKKEYPRDYDVDGSCYIHWEMVELKRLKALPGLPKPQWTESI
jgi:hypothetical protein